MKSSATPYQSAAADQICSRWTQAGFGDPAQTALPHDDSQRPGHSIPVQSILSDPKAAPGFSKHVATGDLPRQCGLRESLSHHEG